MFLPLFAYICMNYTQNGSISYLMENERPVPPPVKDITDTQGTAARMKYLLRHVLQWKDKIWADKGNTHERTLANYLNGSVDPIGKQIRDLIKAANSTLAFVVGETDEPGPDPFGKRNPVLTDAQKQLLKLLEDEFKAAVRLRENSQLEYEAAVRYRQEYERINNLREDILQKETEEVT